MSGSTGSDREAQAPGKAPLIVGLVCIVLWVILAFEASASYDTDCVRGTLRCGPGVAAVYTASGLVAGLALLAWAGLQWLLYRRRSRQAPPGS